jgi:hypothetical protein
VERRRYLTARLLATLIATLMETQMKFARWGILLLLVSPLATAVARPQHDPTSSDQTQDPLVAASLRAQAEKKAQPKPVKVWTNDSLPTTGAINVVGQTSSPAPDSTTVSATVDKAPTAPVDAAGIQVNLDSAKQELESLKTDLDILQRRFTLDQQMYLSKPEYSSDKAGAAALQDEKDQMDAKQQAIADAEKKVAEMQAKLEPGANAKQ